jgi:radical SAM protein with 4Fe4S-binding SPASM domain
MNKIKTDILHKPINVGLMKLDSNCFVMNFDNGLGIIVDDYELAKKFFKGLENASVLIGEKEKELMIGLIKNKIIMFNSSQKLRNTPIKTTVYIGVTDICNYNCVYCYGAFIRESSSIDFDYITLIDAIMKRYEVDTFVLTGGEPTLFSRVFHMAEYIKKRGIKVSLNTNGSLVDEKNVKSFKVFDYITISLDGHNSKINDFTRGKGAFEQTLQGIKNLCENNIDVTVATVINKYNVSHIKELYNFTEKLGVANHTFADCLPIGRGSKEICLSSQEINDVNNELACLRLDSMKEQQVSFVKSSLITGSSKVSCGMGINEIYVNNIGDIYPCRMSYSSEYKIGNVFKSTRNEIDYALKTITGNLSVDNLECKSCIIKYYCGGGCRIAHSSYTGNIAVNYTGICEIMKNQCLRLSLINAGLEGEAINYSFEQLEQFTVF